MHILLSRSELDKLDTSIFTLNHTICTDLEKDVYPKLMSKPKVLITDEFVRENYYLNEEKIVSIMRSISFLTGIPVVYMTKTLDYIASKYNTEDSIIVVNEDILTYPVMNLDSIIDDTELKTHIKASGRTMHDVTHEMNKLLDSLKLFENEDDYINYIVNNLDSFRELFSLFEVINQDNVLMKEQIRLKASTTDNLVEKVKYLEEEKIALIENINKISMDYNEMYNASSNTYALLKEYMTIYNSLSMYGIHNESMHIKKYVDTNSIKISKPPIFLYIKEYDYQPLFKELLLRIPTLMKDNYGILSKVVVLDNADTIREREYIDFMPFVNGITLGQFIDFDSWVNYGNPFDILNLLAHNEASFDLYIVWDRTGFKSNSIQGDRVVTLAMLENLTRCDLYKLKPNNCISSKNTPIVDVKEYRRLESNERLLNTVLANSTLYLELYNLYKSKIEEDN